MLHISFWKIRRIAEKRRELNVKLKRDIHAAKMFLPVVVALLVSNLEPIIHYIYIQNGTIYRELNMAMLLSFAFNSSVNLPIYYWKAGRFRKETKLLAWKYVPYLKKLAKKDGKLQKMEKVSDFGPGSVGSAGGPSRETAESDISV